MALTLESNRQAIAAATLTYQKRGTSGCDPLLAPRQNSELIGGAGNYLLRCNTVNDALWDGKRSDRQFRLHPPGHAAPSSCRSSSVLPDDKRQTGCLSCTYEALSLEQ
jgi:hypothetical protein